jgi:hypothetical protein
VELAWAKWNDDSFAVQILVSGANMRDESGADDDKTARGAVFVIPTADKTFWER